MFSFRVLALFGVCLFSSATTFAGSDLPQRFIDVSKDVVSRVLKIESCHFLSSAPQDVVRWILRNREAFANDVAKSRHEWLTGQASCAHTKAEAMATIYFSYTGCDSIGSSTADITRVLVEQSVYHLGIVDDSFAKSVARAFVQSSPSCEPSAVADPFGPRYCPSSPVTEKEALRWLDLPNTFTAKIGDVRLATRGRRCYDVGGCQPWAPLEKWTADYSFEMSDSQKTGKSGYSFAQHMTSWKAPLVISLLHNKPLFSFAADISSNSFYYFDKYERSFSVSQVRMTGAAIVGEPMTGIRVTGYYGGSEYLAGLKGQKVQTFAGNLGRDCLWLSQTSDYRAKDTSGNSYTFESQMVFYSKF